MLRFVMIHYLAFYTALVPTMCCCIATSNVKAATSIDDSEQTEAPCCRQKHGHRSRSQQCPTPVKNDRKECPCESGKTFLVNVHSLNQSDTTSRFGYDPFEDGVLFASALECLSNLNLHYTSLGFVNSCSRSAVEILRANCVLRC